MGFSSLRVIHQRRGTEPSVAPAGLDGSFHIETCQRRLWITTASRLASVNEESLVSHDLFFGIDAYEFLLRVASGLESEVKGETEIFGQIKCAWQAYAGARPADFKPLAPLIQRLFEDTKEIRSRYLQGFGGSSYGSLVRKMLRGRSRGPVLLAGAGQLAEAVLPYLREFEVLLWNRSEERVRALLESVKPAPGASVRVIPAHGELEAWASARHAVVCIPADPAADRLRIQAWKGESVIHLGCTDQEPGPWGEVANFSPLKDLFEIRKSQDRARTEQIEKAFAACRELAGRRSLELPVNASAALESLALFA